MNKHWLLLTLTLIVAPFCIPNADAAKKMAPKADMKLIEAYTQNLLPGMPGGEVKNETHIVIIWKGSTYPDAIFWRGAGGFMPCNIEKAHKLTPSELASFPPGMAYNTESLSSDQIHKGDTLMLTPMKGGKYPIPAVIPKNAKNTLFYTIGHTEKSKWLAFPVSKIGTRQDVPMP